MRVPSLLPALLVAWGVAAACLLGAASVRGFAVGDAGEAPARWPAATRIALAPDRPTVVLFAHPRCPCTHATLSELARALALVPAARLEVRFLLPEGSEHGWAQTALWSRAAAIDGAHVDVDVGGQEAARFDARTSGLVLAYAPDGRRLFAGGVTSARGHEGDSAGKDAFIAALRDDRAAHAAVYGCAL